MAENTEEKLDVDKAPKDPLAGEDSDNLQEDPGNSLFLDPLYEIEDTFEEEPEREKTLEDVLGPPNSLAIFRLTNLILVDAYRRRATDIYYEFGEEKFEVKYRIDGELRTVMRPPLKLSKSMREELKLRFGLLEKKPKPLTFWQRVREIKPEIEVVSTGDYGSNHIATTTFRVGKEKVINLNLGWIIANGQEQYHLELFDWAQIPETLDEEMGKLIETTSSGLILLSSPPNQGKTTTAYQMLAQFNIENRMVVAVEQKGAYPFSGIVKIKANPNSGDYEQTLNAIRMYHPEVLFFDDVSDERTAKEVLEYAGNGQLVIAAVAAKSAARSLEYLVELNENIAKHPQDLRGLVSQRLVKRVHDECKGAGCRGCNDNGYAGRVAAYQVVDSSEMEKYREALSKRGAVQGLGDLSKNSFGSNQNVASALPPVIDTAV